MVDVRIIGGKLGSCGLFPCSGVGSFAFTGKQVRTVFITFPFHDDVPTGSHPHPRKERKQSDGAESPIGLGKQHNDHGPYFVGPLASAFAFVEKVEDADDGAIAEAKQSTRVNGIPTKASAGREGEAGFA